MLIDIKDETNKKFSMGIEQEVLDLSPWVVLNMSEIGIAIAYSLFDAEYDIREEDIDYEINDFLSYLHRYIRDKAIDVLEDNGREVY